MAATLDRELLVATCIACGARSRAADGEEDCDDVALDLVEVADVDAERERVEALEESTAALRELAAEVDGGGDWDALRARAREALLVHAPPEPQVEVVEAWGCPSCGRIDAPQPCLGVCIRRPVLMTDAAPYRGLAARAAELAGEEGALRAALQLVARVRPRPGQEEPTRDALRARVRAALAAS